jgi:HD-GYP domain-containing protein (c-di-GMP phosphodiesterase class II)
MRLVAIDSVEPGALLARDVWGGSAGITPLLRAGTALRDTYIQRLIQGGIAAVYIDDVLSAGIDIPEVLRASTQLEAGRVLEAAFSEMPGVLAAAGGAMRMEIALELRNVVKAIIEDLKNAGDAMLAFTDLATADAYTMQHSIDTTVLGILLGRKLFQDYGWIDFDGTRRYDKIDERLIRLGLGLLLHDIGKVTVPSEVLNKKGPLDASEWALIRAYPAAGADMLTDDAVGPRARSIVRSHHERYDGTGYPAGLKGENIPQLARIAAVADVFDAVTSARPYRAAAPACVGVDAVIAGDRTLFDPEVVSVFRAIVAPHPVGTSVWLSDGREGIVLEVPPSRADRPVIRVVTDHDGTRLETPIEVALIRSPEIEISISGWQTSGTSQPTPAAA